MVCQGCLINMNGNKAEITYTSIIITITIKFSPVLRPVPFRSWSEDLLEGKRGPGHYSTKYGA